MRNVLKTPRGEAWGWVDSVGAGGEGDGSVRGGTASTPIPQSAYPVTVNRHRVLNTCTGIMRRRQRTALSFIWWVIAKRGRKFESDGWGLKSALF